MTCGVITAMPILTMEFVWFGKEATQRAGRVLRGVTTAGASGLIEAAGQTSRSAIILDVIFTPRTMSLIQGLYYVASGLWPLVSMDTFVAVSGPKTDLWLVRTVALLIICIGAAVLLAAKANRVTAPIVFLALSAASSLAWTDTYYSLRGVIWPIYLLDAFAEAILLAGWAASYLISRRQAR